MNNTQLPAWGKRGRPPKSAAGTYTPLNNIPAEPGPGRGYGGQRVTANRGGIYQPLRAPDAKAAARALYESQPGATCQWVAEQLGGNVPTSTVRRWKAEGGWRSVARTVPDLPARAGQLANTFKVKMSELGKPLDDEVAASEVAKEIATQEAVNVRAAVLDRHRKEWSAPRKLIYDAVQKRDMELAKLAKIAGETLQIVQQGECRAYGLDHNARGADGGTIILVQREGQVEMPKVEDLRPIDNGSGTVDYGDGAGGDVTAEDDF